MYFTPVSVELVETLEKVCRSHRKTGNTFEIPAA